MIKFKQISEVQSGLIYQILNISYQGLFQDPKIDRAKYLLDWQKFDQEVFDNPNTIGKCVFATTLDDKVIGFASFNPRNRPESGMLGHNCILPKFRGRGFGKA